MNTLEEIAAQLEWDIVNALERKYSPRRSSLQDECHGVDASKLGTRAEQNFRTHLGDRPPANTNTPRH